MRGLSRVRNIRGSVRNGGRMKKRQSNIPGSCIEDILRRGEEIMKEDAAEFDANVVFSSGVDGRRGSYNAVDNPPTIVLFLGKSVSKCQGCLGTIKRAALPPPQDMCLTIQDFRSYYCNEQKKQKTYYGNIYFHLTMECLKRKYPTAVLDDVTIKNDTLALLTNDHLKYLRVTGFLESTIRKKRKQIGK